MKPLLSTLFSLGLTLSPCVLAQSTALAVAPQEAASIPHAESGDGPAQQLIAAAQQQLKADSSKVQAWDALASAFIRRNRETGDPSFLKEADDALSQGLKLDATNFQLLRTRMALMLSRQEFAQAKELASELNHRVPDDVMTYGYLAEAELALGDYQQAETNAQWMMNMRPNNTPALLIGSELRAVWGDSRGAIEFLNQAYTQTSPLEVEELAWMANKIATIQLESGLKTAAEQSLQRAEQLFPHYLQTVKNLASVRLAQNRSGDAVELLTQAASIDRDPHTLYELSRAQEAAGRSVDARATLVEFTRRATDSTLATDQSRLDLILLESESPATAPSALKLAQQQIELRQDVNTLDAYAWALYSNGKLQDAEAAEHKAIAVGVQSAQIFDHAGHIEQKLNHEVDADKFFRLAIQWNSSSPFAADAMRFAGHAAEVANQNQEAVPTGSDPEISLAENPEHAQRAQPDHLPVAHRTANTNAAYNFSRVPDDLLTPRPTETGHLIKEAQSAVARNPQDAAGFAGLGAAYFQRARETGDVSDYQFAEESITKSLDLVSTDFSAGAAFETMAEICMGEHRFADALSYAHKALSLGSGDVSPFAIVGDAYADMGEYEKAADAYGRLTPRDMTLSPRAAYARDSRLSYLKFVAGDTAAAITLMKTAVEEGVAAQLPSENLAWLYFELGEYESQAGDATSADAAYLASLQTHPGDYRALAGLAKLRAGHGRYEDAILLYQKAIAVVPMPTFIAELGDLYANTGDRQNAQKQYALVEYIGLLGRINQVLHNRDLAIFYADHDIKLAESLDLARKELEVRHDVYTWDALAWALYKNGKLADAASASAKALKFQTQDSLLLFHAGIIAAALGQQDQARRELEKALQINPHFHPIYAKLALDKVTELTEQSKLAGGSENHAH